MDFKKFKQQRKEAAAKVASNLSAKKPSYIDDRFWDVTKDKMGNGEAIIRFLPQKDIDALYYLTRRVHGFDVNGTWFIENCPTTLNHDCPVCDYAKTLWEKYKKNKTDENKAIASKFSSSPQSIVNIMVVNDPAKPDNNGKVFLYKIGMKVTTKILDKIAPKSELDEPINVFDLWEGRNFKLCVKRVGGFNNYDSSEFRAESTPVAKTDDAIEEIYNQIRDLNGFLEEKEFKTFDEIETKFNKIMGSSKKSKQEDHNVEEENEKFFDDDSKPENQDEKTYDDSKPEKGDDSKPEKGDDDDFDFDSLTDDDFDFEK
jgi:hypothetical protein